MPSITPGAKLITSACFKSLESIWLGRGDEMCLYSQSLRAWHICSIRIGKQLRWHACMSDNHVSLVIIWGISDTQDTLYNRKWIKLSVETRPRKPSARWQKNSSSLMPFLRYKLVWWFVHETTCTTDPLHPVYWLILSGGFQTFSLACSHISGNVFPVKIKPACLHPRQVFGRNHKAVI